VSNFKFPHQLFPEEGTNRASRLNSRGKSNR